jgi:hypothetical protein
MRWYVCAGHLQYLQSLDTNTAANEGLSALSSMVLRDKFDMLPYEKASSNTSQNTWLKAG